MNTDNGPGPAHGWHSASRADVKTALGPLSRKLLAGLGREVDDELTCDTDHASFLVRGVPALNLWVDMDAYMEVHHMPSDTFDKIVPAQLSADTAIVAVTTYAPAEQAARLAPRLDRPAVEKLLGDDNKSCFEELREPPAPAP